MKKVRLFPVLCILVLLVTGSGVMQASAISGSLPFVLFSATENGPNLASSTMEFAVLAVTSGSGTGDFSVIPLVTTFGPISLDDLTVSTGGGFSISNATYGSFTASGGTIIHQSSSFLDVSLTGTYVPGPGLLGASPTPAEVDMSFNQTGASLSGSFTLAAVPEPAAMALLGSGILVCARMLRRRGIV
jgi:PEP-CTERM motif-containing protein